MTLWNMVNVLPGSPLEKGIAAFPDELAYRCIKLFSYVGRTVLDPLWERNNNENCKRTWKKQYWH